MSSFLLYRSRLETNAEQWNNLLKTLKELIDWTIKKDEEIQKAQPIGGDLSSVKKQAEIHQVGVKEVIGINDTSLTLH